MQIETRSREVRRLPARWGEWFARIADSTMKKTDLNIFYQMGQSLGYLMGEGSYGTGKDIAELALHLYFPRDWAIAFVRETQDFDKYLHV